MCINKTRFKTSKGQVKTTNGHVFWQNHIGNHQWHLYGVKSLQSTWKNVMHVWVVAMCHLEWYTNNGSLLIRVICNIFI
jgi:hypothetical protein